MTAPNPDFPAEREGGVLAACPDSPNCVSTTASSDSQKMAPLSFSGSAKRAEEAVKSTISRNFRRANLVKERDGYLRYEFVSFIFRFVDDVEFVVDDRSKVIQFRSASRAGHSDLGVNRKRMERFSRAFNQTVSLDADRDSVD